ncbi:MAG: hypothetical protein KA170_11765 [Candidatus Promineofilum sp.]|nr:hypothetical protein [Promineifilum sp.]
MSTPTVAEYLKFANLQMAAEAFLVDIDENGNATVKNDIPKALTEGNLHASKFTTTEATKFAAEWQVVAQMPNTTTGFSGTLFRNRDTREYVISFRSTEFVDDAIRDSAATNTLEVFKAGWAFGQLSDMEAWYQSIKSQIDGPLSVTGYSLGGHLATAFNLLRREDAAAGRPTIIPDQVVTFNGAGVGTVKAGHSVQSVLDYFNSLRGNPTQIKAALGFTLDGMSDFYDTLHQNLAGKTWTAAQAKAALAGQRTSYIDEMDRLRFDGETRSLQLALDAIVSLQAEAARINGFTSGGTDDRPLKPVSETEILAQTLDYRLAVYLASQRTTSTLSVTSKTFGGPPLTNQYDLVGKETTQTPWSAVANSGVHYGTNVDFFIEDQPQTRGNFVTNVLKDLTGFELNLLQDKYGLNNFADSHSLVLIVDSLKVQDALLNLVDPAQRPMATATLTTLLKNTSWRKAEANGGTQGKAEGDVLENVVNALADLILGPQSKAERLNGNPNGNTWADIADKPVGDTNFSGREALYAKLQAITDPAGPYSQLLGKLSLAPSAGNLAQIARNDYFAYAALDSLSPFAFRNDGLLDDAALGAAFGPRFADWKTSRDAWNNNLAGPTISDDWLADRAAFLQRKTWYNANNVLPDNPSLELNRERQPAETFNPFELENRYYEDRASGYTIQQGRNLDNTRRFIFGDERTDSITGAKGDDHLYGGAGNDHLIGGLGNDILVGGKGNDILEGGAGEDTYIINSGDGIDTIIDEGPNHILYNGKRIAGTFYKGEDGKYRFVGSNAFVLAFDSPGVLTFDANTQIRFQNQTSAASFASHDFGITLKDIPAAAANPTPINGDLEPTEFFTTQLASAPLGSDWRNVRIVDVQELQGGVIWHKYGYNKIDGLGNLIVAGDSLDRADILYGSTATDKILGKGGDDRIEARGGNDLVEGGAGYDILLGEEGDDRLYSETVVTMDQLHAHGQRSADPAIADGHLDGGTGDDLLVGADGNDVLIGSDGADLLVGGAGNDQLRGYFGYWTFDTAADSGTPTQQDVLYGGAGRDVLEGAAGNDMLDGGSDDDLLFGSFGNDYLDGGEGDDRLVGGGEGDELFGGKGADRLEGDGTSPRHGDDYLDGEEGNDKLWGNRGNDELFGGEGDDDLVGDSAGDGGAGDGDDYLDGEDGNDRLWGDGGRDQLFGGEGDDELAGDSIVVALAYHGNDYLDGEGGNDHLFGLGGADTLIGGEGNDYLQGDLAANFTAAEQYQGADLLYGGEGNDALKGDGGADILNGEAGNDILDGGKGNDLLAGGEGNDVLHGDEDNDTLNGGAGKDFLAGGKGDDIYEINRGDGPPPEGGITAADTVDDEAGTDTIRLGEGILPVDVSILGTTERGFVLVAGSDHLFVKNGLRGSIERFEFADGTVLSARELLASRLTIPNSDESLEPGTTMLGGSAADSLRALGGGATIIGGRDADTIRLAGSDNTLIYAKGDGTDHVTTEGGAQTGNVLRLEGVGSAELTLGLGSLALHVGDDPNDVIHFESFDPGDVLRLQPFDHIEFDDGTTLGYEDLMARGFDIAGGEGYGLLESRRWRYGDLTVVS